MQISNSSMSSEISEIQRMLASLQTQATSSAGQSLPTASQDQTSAATPVAPPGPPPGGDSQASSRFAANTLSSLLGVQQQAPQVSSFATKLIGQVDSNGDGQLSLTEIEQALGQGSTPASGASATTAATAATTAAATDPLAAAFAKLDTNGDGQISGSELTAALKAHHHHGHHRHGGGDATQSAASAPAAATTTTDTTVTASTTTTTTEGSPSAAAAG